VDSFEPIKEIFYKYYNSTKRPYEVGQNIQGSINMLITEVNKKCHVIFMDEDQFYSFYGIRNIDGFYKEDVDKIVIIFKNLNSLLKVALLSNKKISLNDFLDKSRLIFNHETTHRKQSKLSNQKDSLSYNRSKVASDKVLGNKLRPDLGREEKALQLLKDYFYYANPQERGAFAIEVGRTWSQRGVPFSILKNTINDINSILDKKEKTPTEEAIISQYVKFSGQQKAKEKNEQRTVESKTPTEEKAYKEIVKLIKKTERKGWQKFINNVLSAYNEAEKEKKEGKIKVKTNVFKETPFKKMIK
jgi:hypothetical protein